MKKSEKNLALLENFILYITSRTEGDSDSNTQELWTANELYQSARNYIEEDHVDGRSTPTDSISDLGAEELFYDVLKPAMIRMAVEDRFPLDLNQLQLEDLVGEIEGERKPQHLIMLTDLISYDDEMTIEEAYDALVAQSKIDGTVLADDVLTMWEKVESNFTVDQLLEYIL